MPINTERVLEQFPLKRVVVLGDFYLDEYFHCNSDQLSPEAPVPRAVINKVEHVPGCAGNVAIAFRSLGAQVQCAGVIGNDEKGKILTNKLLEKGIVTSGLIPDMTRHTGVFSRILLEGSGNTKQHFVRFDLENKEKINAFNHGKIKEFLRMTLPDTDLLFVADYDEADGTGLINKDFLKEVIEIAKQTKTKVVGISRLQIKDFEDCDIIVCNKKEVGETVGLNVVDDRTLDEAANKLLHLSRVKTLIVTQGKDGVVIFKNNGEIVKLSSFAKEVVDVCGAGDTLSATYSLCDLIDIGEEDKGKIASYAAAVAVSKEGTAPVFPKEILKFVSSSDVNKKVSRNYNKLVEELDDLKQKGKKIVLTNGFFDFIHSGQIDFLRKAKELGDVLVVAINSDRSARENKGEGRPILNEEERLNVLSSMDFVDYVVVFDELTPLNILSVLKPHILAKGGISYEEVIGRELVESFGGKVELIPLCGMSTSSLIEKVLKSNENKR